MKTIRTIMISVAVVAIIIAVSCLAVEKKNDSGSGPDNIILFIGDGMGVAQVTAALTVAGAPLHIESMPVIGLSRTSASDRYVTDSAAGGTAIATGSKTRNGMIAMAPDSTVLETIVEISKKQGLSTGVISTSSVTHATPASFVAHVVSRNSYEEIAKFFLNGTVDVFMGGGREYFNDRSDSINLLDRLSDAGYQVIADPAEMKSIKKGKVAALFYDGHMPRVTDGRSVSLSEMTRKAIDLLAKNDRGFFLMVEGSMIDWGGHDNDTDYITSETLDMDEAIGEALAFAAADGNTLVIVTADHETGGMALIGGNLQRRTIRAEYPTTDHTAIMVPVFASGPGAEKFSGIMENTELFERMTFALGINK
jgi:alkaline phosphatase